MSFRLSTPPRHLPLFSSRPGIKIYLPGSPFVVQVFPTALRLFLCGPDGFELQRELIFPKLGPVQDWRVLLDAMRRTLCLEGKAQSGFFRIRLDFSSDELALRSLKGPLDLCDSKQPVVLQKNESIILGQLSAVSRPFPMPRLLLGCNKAFNWDRISASPDMNEVLPLWYQFGCGSQLAEEPSTTLFGRVVEVIRAKKRADISFAFDALLRAGTDGMFVPKKTDDCFLGYAAPAWPEEMELSSIQSHVGSLIRSLFLTEEGSVIDLLPCVPKESLSGRLLHEQLSSGHTISIEWRKGVLRRVLLRAAHDGLVTLRSSVRNGWIRSLRTPTRKRSFMFDEPIDVQNGEEYLLDNFSV
jgi:hypothetical protein